MCVCARARAIVTYTYIECTLPRNYESRATIYSDNYFGAHQCRVKRLFICVVFLSFLSFIQVYNERYKRSWLYFYHYRQYLANLAESDNTRKQQTCKSIQVNHITLCLVHVWEVGQSNIRIARNRWFRFYMQSIRRTNLKSDISLVQQSNKTSTRSKIICTYLYDSMT